ncbi:MAG TPA: NADH-quinone oxidoreductase subunit NuoN [Pararhizobium sp.]|nr:NADH-quinone oxidoreductase subunit NuoN [Pararhizobium sp.]
MTADLLATSLHLSAPEIILALGAMALLMIGVFTKGAATTLVTGLAVAVLIFAGLWIIFVGGTGAAYGGAFMADPFAHYLQIVILLGSIATLVVTVGHGRSEQVDKFEFPVLVVLSTLGMMLMVSANSLISLYLGLELQSLALYVLAAINRESVRSTEAGLKYFVLGALASGIMLYGMSLVYGFTGHIGFPQIAGALEAHGATLGLIFGLVFVLAGMVFKISAVPFHMWTPDVYEGAPTAVTTFFATAPKVAAMGMVVRIVAEAFHPIAIDWQQILVFVSIASMILGAFAAIGQRNIKRMMAYSSIGHMGYALVGLAAGTEAGVRGVLLYMLIYMVMTLGAFACILAMRRREDGDVEMISDLAGLASTKPMMATVMTIMMFSLAGVPPLAGFFGKYFVFMAAIQAHLYALAVIGVISSVVACYYYLYVVKVMWFDKAEGEFVPVAGELRVVFAATGLFTLFYVVFGGPIGLAAAAAAKTFF